GAGGGAAATGDPAGAATGAPDTGPRVPVPGLRGAPRPGPPPPPLGEWRPDSARQPCIAVPVPPPGGPRGGLPGRARRRGRAALSHPAGLADPRSPATTAPPARPDADARRDQPGERPRDRRGDGVPRVVR